MPGRLYPLVTNEIYHVFNRGIDHRPTFTDVREYKRALITLRFYQFPSPPIKLSQFLILSREKQKDFWQKLKQQAKLIEFLSYSLMPNHFHFLLRQKKDKGISQFMSNFQNSYTRYFNTRHKRTGPLFLDQFKAVRIETEEQLLHVSRYIHLNPYSSFVVKTQKDLEIYPWSSFSEYLGRGRENFCEKETVLANFKNQKDYQKFIFNQADYQRSLEKVKHLVFE